MTWTFSKWDVTVKTGWKPWWLPAEISIGLDYRVGFNSAKWGPPKFGYYSDYYDGQHHSIWLGWAYIYWLT